MPPAKWHDGFPEDLFVEHDMTAQRPADPLHGVTLEAMLNHLVARLGWDGMAREVDIRCFSDNPSIKSSLTFLRRTPWARAKVEELYRRNL